MIENGDPLMPNHGWMMALTSLTLMASCAPQAHWPSNDEAQATTPDHSAVVEVIATSVDWWTTRSPSATSTGPVMVALTPSLEDTRAGVAAELPACEVVDLGQPNAIIIEGVRMHIGSAQVDLSAPRVDRGRQLLTLNLQKFPLTAWEVRGANWWRFNDRQLDRITNAAHMTAIDKDDFESSEDDASSGSTPEATANATDDH